MEPEQATLIDLIEQMPPTDRELEAIEAAQKPSDPDQPEDGKKKPVRTPHGEASKFTGPDPELAEKICEQILAEGRARLIELIGLIRDPGDPEFKNYKAEYLMHCVVIHAGRQGRKAQRRLVMDALASQLGNDGLPKEVRRFLIRELRWIGDERVANELGKLLDDEDLCQDAVMALAALGAGSGLVRAALRQAKGRNRLALVQHLGLIQDKNSVELLRLALADEDREMRLAAAWGLANLADASSIDPILKLADTDANYERVKATQASLLLAEKLVAAGKPREAARIYTHLRDTRKDKTEKYIRDLAENALGSLVV
jgi:hypothetical protein